MESRAYTGDDDREFGPAHIECRECGACTCEDCDGHEMNCSYHPDAFEPRGCDVEPAEGQ
jgi:hypothetical protein